MNQGEGATNSRTQITAIVSVLVPALSSNNRGRFTAALACISDIVLAVQEDFKPHLSSIMPVLLPMLEDKELHDDHPNNKLAISVSYTHLRAHETPEHLVCRLLLEKKKNNKKNSQQLHRD
eukprot:TRINITY_DN30886_c0_g1_i1.p1 TRINITY_DN30886_c0_g1~~TRINITY_DN30886_c0_g1_i1.p1  ORF type:complete len:121 (-),score=22.98 TRINITY_DN30886_c0_g1_i1:70-432(-)